MVIALTGIAYADQGVPAVPENQGLVTGTTADVVGLAMETDAGTWTLTNDPTYFITVSNSSSTVFPPNNVALSQLVANGGSYTVNSLGALTSMTIPSNLLNQNFAGNGNTWGDVIQILKNNLNFAVTNSSRGIHDGVLDPGQVQYTTAYDANIVAQAGHTSLVKSMNIDTRNKVISQSNINAQTALTFVATSDGGDVVGSENLMLDGAGQATSAADRILCPFVATPTSIIPAYCNIVQAGSKYDLTVGSVTTTANDKFVSGDASAPVVLNYNINVKPYGTTSGQIPAIGSTSAYIKAHIQEARTTNYVNVSAPIQNDDGGIVWAWVPTTPQKNEDLTYSEISSAQGTITAFNQEMSYSSQVTGVAIVTPVPTQHVLG